MLSVLVGLSRQLPNATLLGTNTGPYPDGNSVDVSVACLRHFAIFQSSASFGSSVKRSATIRARTRLLAISTTTLSSVMRFANSELEP